MSESLQQVNSLWREILEDALQIANEDLLMKEESCSKYRSQHIERSQGLSNGWMARVRGNTVWGWQENIKTYVSKVFIYMPLT